MARAEGREGRARVLVVVGTRPEAVKMAPVLRALQEREGDLETALALTGQHTAMVDQVLTTFGMEPDFDLQVMREGQDQYDLAHACLDGLRRVTAEYRPDLILVQGDTATVFYASLVGFLERVRVGHVEAGLRSRDKWAPFPEEVYRRLADVLADLYFAPTPRARENLLGEGIPAERIYLTGNPVVDAIRAVAGREGAPENRILGRLRDSGAPFALLTAHRRESFGAPLREVFSAILALVETRPELEILYPVHLNPQVQEPAREILSGHPRVHLTEPLGYLDLVRALSWARLVLTDSGGIQEEAPTFGVPVLVLREVTERPEGVEAGVARLVGTRKERILEAALSLLGQKDQGNSLQVPLNPYGDGKAGERIADIVQAALTGAPRKTADWDGL